MLLNSQKPYSEETRALAARMTEKYEVQVLPVNCEQLRAEDIREILGQVLLEFPVTEIDFRFRNGWRFCQTAIGLNRRSYRQSGG